MVQQKAISLFTQSPADDGFDQRTSWQFIEYFKVEKLVIGQFFQKVSFLLTKSCGKLLMWLLQFSTVTALH